MFDLSFAEIILIVVVAVVFLGPKELPVVVRAIARAMRYLRELAHEVRKAFDDLAKEAGADEIKAEVRMIQGDDGQWYESYHPEKISSPSQGENKGGGLK
jgi:sec-independent protein translocase protein TatB